MAQPTYPHNIEKEYVYWVERNQIAIAYRKDTLTTGIDVVPAIEPEGEFLSPHKAVTIRIYATKKAEVLNDREEAAGTAPSGAHKQPWTFCLVTDPEIRKEIRKAAEEEEYTNYHGRMSDEWLEDLKKFNTDHIKPFIENAPGLITKAGQVLAAGAADIVADVTVLNN